MSTKATIACGRNFHLYEDMGDREQIYLQLDTTNFEAGYGQVIVPIPVHIWEVIREFSGVRLNLAELTDKELRQKVEQEVDERIAKWNEAKQQKAKSIWRWAGSLAFGDADEPRAKQVQAGLRYYRHERKWQREVKAAIEKLRWENSPEGRKHRMDEHNRKAEALQNKQKARIKS